MIDIPESLLGFGSYFALNVVGDSMIDIGINDGDIAIIRQKNEAKNGDLVVALINETEATLKRLKKAKKKYDLTSSLFLEQSLHKLKTFISLDTLKALFQLKTFELQKSLHQANTQSFSSPHLIQLFDRYATYNGSDPYQTSGSRK